MAAFRSAGVPVTLYERDDRLGGLAAQRQGATRRYAEDEHLFI